MNGPGIQTLSIYMPQSLKNKVIKQSGKIDMSISGYIRNLIEKNMAETSIAEKPNTPSPYHCSCTVYLPVKIYNWVKEKAFSEDMKMAEYTRALIRKDMKNAPA